MKPQTKPTHYHQLLMRPYVVALMLFSPAGAFATDYPTTVLQDGPSAYYRFEEAAGSSSAADSSSNMVSATIHNNGASTSPVLGQAGLDTNSFLFANPSFGDFGYVDIPYSSLVAPIAANGTSSAPFSTELWVQPTSFPADWQEPIEVAQYPLGWCIYMSGATGGNGDNSYFYLNMRGGAFGANTAQGAIQFLKWYHLVVTFDGTTAILYVNGSPQSFNAAGFTPLNTAQTDVHVGSGQGLGWLSFNGAIDEVAFYTNVLSMTQVTNHYAVGLASIRFSTNPPTILDDLTSTNDYSGVPYKFTVSASGASPLHYYWTTNSVHTGPDAPSLAFTPHYPGDNGSQVQVIVSNFYGSATSSVATLTVNTNVNIVSPPTSITRNVGSYAAFHVTANGALPVHYQWSNSVDAVNFTAIAGATNQTLWLTNVQLSQSGNTYAVAVINPFTSTTVSATLTVQARTDPPVSLTGYGAIVAADKPVAYYRLDETNGTLAEDAVGSFDGTYTPGTGTITYGVATGIPKATDPAVSLASSTPLNDLTGGGTIQIPFAPELNPDTAWSAEIWMNPSSIGGNYRVVFSSQYNMYPNAYNGWYLYQQPNGTLAFVPQPANGFIVAGPDDPANANLLVTNKWYHVVVTDDLTNFNIYMNGELRSSFSAPALNFIPNGDGINLDGTASLGGLDGGNTVIGQRTDAQFGTFQGAVDDVAFYNYALTPKQVLLHSLDAAALDIKTTGTNVVLTWPVGVLQVSTNAAGPYTNVLSATSPKTNAITGKTVFWRVFVP